MATGSERGDAKFKPDVNLAQQKATLAHAGQTRKSGEPYISHPKAVFNIVSGEWGIKDQELGCAAWLHDADEDTKYKLPKIEIDFGPIVASLIDGVSKTGSTKDTHRKGVEASYDDPRTLILKLADRLANIRTLMYLSLEKQLRIARETIGVYVPMATSIGLWRVKTELEDLSFSYVNPVEFASLGQALKTDQRLGANFLDHMTSQLERVIKEAGLIGHVEPRKNGLLTIHNIAQKRGLKDRGGGYHLESIADVVSFRTTFKSLDECYQFLGQVHAAFGSSVNYAEFNEYVGANARSNGYQALQTTISTPAGETEIAIATLEQEAFNDWGIIDQLKKGHSLKNYRRKWVFTPDDEVVFLPPQATAYDMAYALFPSLGAMGTGAIIDGQPKAMSTVVPNGATVQIIPGTERIAPERETLQYCLPATAQIIHKQLETERKQAAIDDGRSAVNLLMTQLMLPNLEQLAARMTPILPEIGCNSLDELYFMAGSQKDGFMDKIQAALQKAGISKEKLGWMTIRVHGADHPGILVNIFEQLAAAGGNVINLDLHVEDGLFQIVLVADKLTPDKEAQIDNWILSDPRFEI